MKTCVFTILVSNDSTLHEGNGTEWRYHTLVQRNLIALTNRPFCRRSTIFLHWSDRGIVRVFFCYSAVLWVVRTPSLPSSMVEASSKFRMNKLTLLLQIIHLMLWSKNV